MNKTIDEMIGCAKRELAMRGRVYPKWVAAGRMREAVAAHEIECLQGIMRVLFWVKRRGEENGEERIENEMVAGD
jgi:hypothetical protein